MSLESPYRPPREVDPSEVSSMPLDPGVFRLDPEAQRTAGRLAKYLREIGGLLIFVAVLSVLFLAFSSVGTVMMGVGAAAVLQLVLQAASTVVLFLIGRFMRQAARPLQAASESPEGHREQLVGSMAGLKNVYETKILYLLVGIAGTILTLAI